MKGLGQVAASSLLALLAGCGGPPPPGDRADDVAPVTTAEVAGVTSADQALWVAQALAQGLDQVAPATPVTELEAEDALLTDGPAAPAIAESTRPIERATPEALLASALDLLAAGDAAALARLSLPKDERATLDEDDAAKAERRFLTASARTYWSKIGEAARRGALAVQPGRAEGEALLRVDVGGAAGSFVIKLRKRGDGWYLGA